jgi:uncharacterized protein YybS (DUF2232 family)
MTYRTLAAHTIASTLICAPWYLSAAELQSPLAFSSFSELVEALLRSIVYIALPIISLFVVYAGFKFVMAQGSSDAISEAKTNILYVLLGSGLILGAWALAELIGNTVNELRR